MNIALLNFPFDNNYGGNLQRYALMKVLEEMGHEVTHLYTCYAWSLPGRNKYVTLAKCVFNRVIRRRNASLYPEYKTEYFNHKHSYVVKRFYDRYVKHTAPITPYDDFRMYNNFDAYIVGSDQVWRRSMSGWFPYPRMFFDFVRDRTNVKRISYGVSFGNTTDELPDNEKNYIGELYKLFTATSVREDSGLALLSRYGWTSPQAIQVLDPTLLLSREHYIELIERGRTKQSEGNLFCYVLDKTPEIVSTINRIADEKHLKPFEVSLEYDNMVTVEQWLRSFLDAEYIVTDSYHGFVFSMIFHKPVKLTYNTRRGNERFESIMRLTGYNPENGTPDWEKLERIMNIERKKSKEFLINALK